MQVNNRNVGQPYQMNENSSQIRAGEIGQVVIKEKLENNEAAILFKGQEMTAKIDGPFPSNDRMVGEVVSINEQGQAVIKPISQNTTPSITQKNPINEFMLKLGIDPAANPELREVLNLISQKGYSLSKENIATLQQFLKTQEGSFTDKYSTIQILAQKGLEITATHLSAIHETLHGKAAATSLQAFLQGEGLSIEQLEHLANIKSTNPIDAQGSLKSFIKQLKENPDLAELKRLISNIVKSNAQLSQEVKNDIQKAIQILEAGNARISSAPQDAAKLQQIGISKLELLLEGLTIEKEMSVIVTTEDSIENELQKNFQSVLKNVKKESSITKIIDSVRNLLEQLTVEDRTTLSASLEKATQFMEQGRELAARKELTKALTILEQENPQLQKGTNQTALTQAEQYLINEAIQAMNLDSKNIVVTEITKKLSHLAIDFKKTKQEILRNLDQINRTFEEKKQVSPTQMKQLIESSIKKLDNTILKGNFLLYTDMSTEKKLLKASSQLAEAKNLLTKGNFSEANQIVKEIKSVLDNMTFKPSDVRVKNFVSEQSALLKEIHPPKQLAQELGQAINPFPEQDLSGRSIFETIKRLGLTHEHDLAHTLVGTSKGEHELTSNIKSTLMKMIQIEGGQTNSNTQPLEQALSNLTGQQLLNKQDPSGMQNLFMQLPLLLNKQVENVKVYINSQKKGEKIDWENCSLYFVLETKKLGDVGIQVTATNRNLSITLKNNKEQFAEKMEKLTDVSIQRLKEVGYNVGSIQFKPFSQQEKGSIQQQVNPKSPSAKPTFTEKGYDYTI